MLSLDMLMYFTYPSELEDIILSKDVKKLNVYIDLKNCMKSLFVEDVCASLIENTNRMKTSDSSILQSTLKYISQWKMFGKKCNIEKLRIFISTDIGRSLYHIGIDKNYKSSRHICRCTYSSVHDDRLKVIRDQNFRLSEKICNFIPNVFYICLDQIESDFIPYYILTRKCNKQSDVLHVICSNDKDMLQCLYSDNILLWFRSSKLNKIITSRDAIRKYSNVDNSVSKNKFDNIKIIKNIPQEYITALMAICGDCTDDVPGIKGFGPLNVIKLFKDINFVRSIIGDNKSLNNRIFNGENFIDPSVCSGIRLGAWSKIVDNNDLVTRAFKLISFEQLCMWLEKGDNVDKNNVLRYINSVLTKKDYYIKYDNESFDIFKKKILSLENCLLDEDILKKLIYL